jgi:hypothetical protein
MCFIVAEVFVQALFVSEVLARAEKLFIMNTCVKAVFFNL